MAPLALMNCLSELQGFHIRVSYLSAVEPSPFELCRRGREGVFFGPLDNASPTTTLTCSHPLRAAEISYGKGQGEGILVTEGVAHALRDGNQFLCRRVDPAV